LAHQARNHRAAALDVLARALAFGEPEGFVRTFVDAGEPMARLLYAAIERDIAPHYAGRLLTHFRDLDRPDDAGVTALQAEALIEPLSEREIEVLALIAGGLTNAEIAHRLVITLSTVKGHTSNIYGKLGVSSRTQAVAKARALGLLPAR
jgi:LuxR family transcriptional regulator, maltose regulon positive regulatory protein